jgi:hypothetical protein
MMQDVHAPRPSHQPHPRPAPRPACPQVSVPVLKELYDLYSFNVIPKIGAAVANDEASYQYLVESIRRFPDQVRARGAGAGAGAAAGRYSQSLAAGVCLAGWLADAHVTAAAAVCSQRDCCAGAGADRLHV